MSPSRSGRYESLTTPLLSVKIPLDRRGESTTSRCV